ncbi:MAG: Thymidylate kinase [uncultured bacterium]|nr:MAG: Thymidylate kinase [uncultured bacterium]
MKKGKFIVVDGTDGSGKATQVKELVKNLRKNKIKVKTIDFPRYYNNFFGKFIGECLVGENGNFVKLNPKLASVLYAADRFESSAQIKKWLDGGFNVIADRYVSSNQIHQGGKITDNKKRKDFLAWLEKMEFGIFKLPRPNVIIYLDVPVKITQELLSKEGSQRKKKYQNGKKDLVENDLKYLEKSRKSAIKMLKDNNNWSTIDCVKNGELKTIKEISQEILEKVLKIINNPPAGGKKYGF